jgi:hypothetical protein
MTAKKRFLLFRARGEQIIPALAGESREFRPEYSAKLARHAAGIWRNIAPTWQLDPKRPEPHMKVVYEIRRTFARYAGSGARFASR